MTLQDSSSTVSGSKAAGHELHCPICEYDLHGLPEPRCPECGFAFDWADLQREQEEYPDFFETARADRARAFFSTLARSAFPFRFWRRLHPTLRPRSRRLIVYSLIATVLGVAGALAISGAPLIEFARWNANQRRFILSHYANPRDSEETAFAAQLARPFGSVEQYVDWAYPSPAYARFWKRGFINARGHAFLPAVVIAWPLLTFLGLMIFRVSLLSASISPAHVLRCTVYSADAVTWLFPGLAIALPLIGVFGVESALWSGYLPVALLMLLAVRILIAYRRYLRIKRGLAMVICSQIMAALLFSKLALWLNGY